MIKNKTFIFEELNNFLLFFALIQKIIGRKVYFLRVVKKWQNEKSIKFFKLLGLKWLNYQDYDIKNGSKFIKEGVVIQKQFGDLIEKFNVANDLKEKLTKMGCDSNDLKSLALSKFTEQCKEFCKIIQFLDYLLREQKSNFVVVVNFPDFFKDILKEKIENKAKLLNFNYFTTFIAVIKFFYKRIKLKFKNLLSKKKYINSTNKKVNLEKFSTIFFPHQGIYYGDIFKKDYFYSKKINSNFYPKNILHLSISDQHLNTEKTNEFYKKNDIINIDLNSLKGISLFKIIFISLKFFTKYFFLKKNSLHCVFFFLNLWLSIEKSLIQLDNIPNAKIAIFGFDILSSRSIAIACKIKKITTISIQERFMALWAGNSFFIFDHYLSFNNDIESFLLNERLGTVKKIENIGPIRSDLINTNFSKEQENVERNILILDSHSEVNYYNNGQSWLSNWKQNYFFYKNILNIAELNKNFKFIIKGKDYNFIKIPYFYEIKKKIEISPNVSLHENKKNNSPYELIERAALTIAKYTSSVDELIFKEKPVIIYDTAGYPSIFYNYGKNFYVKDYEELKNKFNLWKENPEGFRENLINETHKYFAAKKSPKKIYEILHEYLEKEFDYYI